MARGRSRMPAYGPLPAPATGYAREGFPVSELIAHDWELNAAARADPPGFAATFLPAGRAPRKGEVFRNPPGWW
ncbi:MAG: gamma-glutamyltransferase [Candidatus Krumholzibacteriia bacterium]